jgi:zinc protease
MLGVLGVSRSDPGYFPVVVANVILSNLGMMGRLGEAVRERLGLVYHIGTDLYVSRGRRPWVVSAGVSPSVLEQAISAIQGELAALRDEPVSPEELADAHALLIGSLPISLETNDGIAGLLLYTERYGLGLDYLERYPALIESVTREQVQAVMQRYWPQGRYVAAAAGSLQAEPDLESS